MNLRNDILQIIEKAKEKHNNKNSLFLEKYLKYYSLPVDDYTILYESFNGSGMIDNPYAIFKEFQSRDDFKQYQHIWVIDGYEDKWCQILEYSLFTNVKFVLYGSDSYLHYLSTSKYLINNCTFPSYFIKKENQVYVNTWHGITRKHLGYDVINSNMDMGNTIRNFLACDYIVSASEYMTNIYLHSYKLDGVWNGKFIEVGQPRNDLTINTDKEDIINKLESYGVNIDKNKKIILYAPTWRGSLSSPSQIDFKSIEKALNIDGYQVLIKSHHVNYSKHKQYIPASIDTNELISICDVLVTDYSSIYYDWIIDDKPVIFFAPDYNEYKDSQGLYYDLPYMYAENIETLNLIASHIDVFFKKTRNILRQENEKFNQYKFGASKKVLNTILDGDLSYTKMFHSDKIKLLFYAGDFKPNGVTTSFTSLLNNIDYSKYDVSIIALKKNGEDYKKYVNSLNKNARVLCRVGTYAQTLLEECANEIVMQKGIGTEYLYKLLPSEIYQREFKRCFGNSKFDKLINFTGYSPFYGFFFMCNAGEKIVWQHNDMIRDQNRCENGIKPLYNTLSVVFTTYPYYDRLVSASKEIMYVNIDEFKNIDREKFFFAHNTIDYKNVLNLANTDNGIFVNESKINFVTTGRLSYAKNQINLVKAFHKFHDKYPWSELYIIGEGNLRDDITKEINGVDYIHLTGYTNNPFNTMKKCDCFVFPSLYEGQGLALIEARMLNLPIIVSPLPKMDGIFVDNGQYELNGFDEDSIYDGLESFIYKNGFWAYNFDAQSYNKKAYKEFQEAIGE